MLTLKNSLYHMEQTTLSNHMRQKDLKIDCVYKFLIRVLDAKRASK